MKKTLLLSALTALSIIGLAQGGKVIDDKNAQKRSVSGYHAITIGGGIDLYLDQSNSEGVAVSAGSASDRDKIRTEVVDGTLKIYMDSEGWNWPVHGNRHLRAYVSCKTLDRLHAGGGSDIYIQGVLKGEKLDLNLSGGSDMRGKIDGGDVSVNQSGGSDSYLSGVVSQLTIHASGGSDFHGYDLSTEVCHVEASGGSDVAITANKELKVNASGGSDVNYKGNAVLTDKRSSGSSSVTRKG
jgi:hypothetical protein